MTTLPEQLRQPLDIWNTREQLCLASAVASSGDQNWLAVSRGMKLVCGPKRPADWFSHKSCAAQYKELLESVDIAKRSKPNSDGKSALVEGARISNDQILKQLTEARIKELNAEIRKEQEEYCKICAELKSLQSGKLNDGEIIEMWKDIQKQQEMQRIEEMKLENQLREREQRNQDMQRTWKTSGSAVISPNYVVSKQEETNLCLQEIIGTSKAIPSGMQQQQQPGTSPLLSSLLKSPTPGCPSPTLGTTAHVTAPTITTLLTGGAINPNQPAITLKNTIPANEATQLLTRPISGPPTESLSVAANASQHLLSPSQSAPTLSMLLEKSKVPSSAANSSAKPLSVSSSVAQKPPSVSSFPASASDSNNEEVPMDIEEDLGNATGSAIELLGVDDSDADANEEEQLLEVFKNIGNIDDLEDIDVAAVINEEVDFLKSVDDETADETEEIPAKKVNSDLSVELTKSQTVTDDTVKAEAEPKQKEADSNDDLNKSKNNSLEIQENYTKIDTISSDDSNDDIPLSTLGGANTSHGDKEKRTKTKEKVDETGILVTDEQNEESKEAEEKKDNLALNRETIIPTEIKTSEECEQTTSVSENTKEAELKAAFPQTSPKSDNFDVIVIPTDDESNSDAKPQIDKTVVDEVQEVDNFPPEQISEGTESVKEKKDTETSATTNLEESSKLATNDSKEADTETPAPTTSLADTDEDSLQTVQTAPATDKNLPGKSSPATKKIDPEKCVDHKTETDGIISAHQTPVRPAVVRKLRERYCSESPITAADDDTTTSEHSITLRSKRRSSATPIAESVPNSPASSERDERDAKSSKRFLMNLYNSLVIYKSAVAFQRAHNEHLSRFREICNRNIDFQIIKKNIESGITRNVHELQRDFLLFCLNGLMVFESKSANYKTVWNFWKDLQNVKEFIPNPNRCNVSRTEKIKESRTSTSSSHASSQHSSGVKVRAAGARKSQRIIAS